jgi:nitrite reductase (NADH) large subunit
MKVLIIGAGPAGIVAAETIRSTDPLVDLDMITSEPYPPYSPPAMADYFLTGRAETLYWKGLDVCDRLDINYHANTTVASVVPDRHVVKTVDGRSLPYDRLLIASGSHLHAPVEGSELPGVHDFKSLRAAQRIVERVRRSEVKTALIVGAGFIGMEIALLLADLGVDVTVVGRRGWVMPRMLDPETAEIAGRAMERRGVTLRLGTEATRFIERDDRVVGVELVSDERLTADIYIAATGVKPNLDFLHGAGITVDWGLTVDRHLRTSASDVWAAGDAVAAPDRLTGQPYVHAIFPNAVEQARVAATNMLGGDVAYGGAETMNSLKHLGLPIMAVGSAEAPDEMRWRDGDLLRKVFLDSGRVVGFRFTGDISAGGILRTLMLRGDDVRRYGRRLVQPGFSEADIALPAMSI